MISSEGVSSLMRKIPLSLPNGWLMVALLLSVGLNIFLGHRVRLLVTEQSERASGHLLGAGLIVQPISIKRLGGRQEVISYQGDNRPTVMYVFSPQCVWCARNMDNFKTLINKANDDYRVIGLSLTEEGLEEYVAKNHLEIPVYFAPKDVQKAYQLGVTPQTIVISSQGRVLKDWPGAYAGEQKSQIEEFFHMALPGVRSNSH